MLTADKIEQFYREVASLNVRFPGRFIAEKTGFSKSTVSEYLNRRKVPSEEFIAAYFEKVKRQDGDLIAELLTEVRALRDELSLNSANTLEALAGVSSLSLRLSGFQTAALRSLARLEGLDSQQFVKEADRIVANILTAGKTPGNSQQSSKSGKGSSVKVKR